MKIPETAACDVLRHFKSNSAALEGKWSALTHTTEDMDLAQLNLDGVTMEGNQMTKLDVSALSIGGI